MNVTKTASPASGAPPAATGKGPPAKGFDALLALHHDEARTASAEGQNKTRGTEAGVDKPAGGDRGVRAHGDPSGTPGHARRADGAPGDPAAEAAPAPAAEVPAVDPLLAALVAAPVPSTTTAVTAAATLPAGPVAQDADGSAPVPAFTITPAGEEPGTATEGDVPLDARTVAAPRPGAISLAGLPAAALVADAATAEPPVAAPQQQPAFTQTGTPAGSPAAVAPVATDPAGTLARSVPDADRPQVPTADRMPMPAADRPADASAATVGQGAAPAGPAASAAGRATLPGNYGLQLAETIREMREVAHVAAMRGGAQARLQLHPAELGGVGVRLTVTAEGLTARLVADRPEAVHALQQAGAELRRSLEDRGLTLVSLDVQLTASAGGGAAREHAAERGQDGAPTSTTSRRTDAADPSDGMEPDAATTTVRTPSGVLVDVLA